MRIISVFVLAFAVSQTVVAFPSAAFNDAEIFELLSRRYIPGSESKRDVGDRARVIRASGLSLGDTVNGLLNGSLPGATLPAVSLPGLGPILIEVPPVVAIGRKEIPDDAHPFKEPAQSDQRGGCPGLNIMANYGYIDRSGVTTATQLLWAQQEMLGLAPDLAAALVGLTAISNLDFSTLKLSIGNKDSRTSGLLSGILGGTPGIFDKATHNTYEVDGSVAYTDSAFTSDGNTNHFNSSKWAESLQIAKDSGNSFNAKWLADARYQHYLECVHTNPNCFWGEKQLVFYLAAAFPQTVMPSADENGAVGPPDLDVIQTFFGVKANGDGTFTHVAEKLPPGPDGHWYRRSIPLTFAELAARGVEGYLAHPVIFGSNSGKPNSFTGSPNQIGNATTGPNPFCLAFNEIQDAIPGPLKPVQSAVLAISNILLAPAKQAIGCAT